MKKKVIATFKNLDNKDNYASVEMDYDVASCFGALKDLFDPDTMLCDEDVDQNTDTITVSLGVKSKRAFERCIEYAKHYECKLPTIESIKQSRNITDPYMVDFLGKLSYDELARLTMTANNLVCPSLQHYCCKQIATYVKTKPKLDFYKLLKIDTPYTARQLEEAKKHAAYVFDPNDEIVAPVEEVSNDNNNNNNNKD